MKKFMDFCYKKSKHFNYIFPFLYVFFMMWIIGIIVYTLSAFILWQLPIVPLATIRSYFLISAVFGAAISYASNSK